MDLPSYELFLNAERMDQFWEVLKWVLFFIAPVIMIFVVPDVLQHLVNAIRKGLGIDKEKDDQDDIYYY
ncbi:hypothetical protein [Piscibacillus halophilus]|uniref:hypothetical protein n=1 Tax=Piscibacillus halophilus TaxID=571933 RepID=UPI00158AF703|nr:hypothetical protein [Piscibacillus halophilus]